MNLIILASKTFFIFNLSNLLTPKHLPQSLFQIMQFRNSNVCSVLNFEFKCYAISGVLIVVVV